MDIKETPYAQWLEEVLRDMVQLEPKQIALCVLVEGGASATSCYNCNSTDKALMAHSIYADSILDVVHENRDWINSDDEEAEDE